MPLLALAVRSLAFPSAEYHAAMLAGGTTHIWPGVGDGVGVGDAGAAVTVNVPISPAATGCGIVSKT